MYQMKNNSSKEKNEMRHSRNYKIWKNRNTLLIEDFHTTLSSRKLRVRGKALENLNIINKVYLSWIYFEHYILVIQIIPSQTHER